MNIGFDGKRAANNETGLGNYSRFLLSGLSRYFRQNQYFVYTPKVKSSRQISTFFTDKNIRLKTPPPFELSVLWRSFTIQKQLRKDNVELYHGLSNEIPLGMQGGPIKTIVTIHDLIFFKFPQNYKYLDRLLYNFKSKYACTHADYIIAVSERTKLDIVEQYNIDPAKIQVIYQSCDESFKKPVPEELKKSIVEKYELPTDYLLTVGTVEPRKNLLLLIRAMANVQSAHKLVVIGKQKAYAKDVKKEIEKLGLNTQVIFLENVPFSDLPALYQAASIFIYPSFYEGFGIPIIEALYGGVPVIAATGSCLEEAGGPDSIYIDPTDDIALSNSINNLLSQPEQGLKMKHKGLEYVQKFNSEDLAKQLMACYTQLQQK